MLGEWLKNDINNLFDSSNIVVLIDENKEYDWLINYICDDLNIDSLKVADYVSDLEIKYLIEKEYRDKKVLIHSYINPSRAKNRHFMIQEYVATGEVFNQHLSRYIAQRSGLIDTDHKFSNEELILAGRISLNSGYRNVDYWNGLIQSGKKAIFGDFNKEVLQFMAEPERYINRLTNVGRKVFYDLVGQYLDFDPEYDTVPVVIANELANSIFKNIIYNIDDTKDIYSSWMDSHKYRQSLTSYLNNYELPEGIDVWKINSNHPFRDIDSKWLSDISSLVADGQQVSDKMIVAIKERVRRKEGMELTGNTYWSAIYKLLTFEAKLAHQIGDLNDFIELYKTTLYKLDHSLRHLYQSFMDNGAVLKAFKALYEEKMRPYLTRWFDLFSQYRENQSKYLYDEILSKSYGNVAIIVGDAISYEVSQEIAEFYDRDENFEVTNSIINGNYPTTTVNNMSSLFGSLYTLDRKKREQALEEDYGQEINFFELDQLDLNEVNPDNPVILYGSDIDKLSEEGHESALKYYQVFIDTVVEKIKKLLDYGYAEVHLVTDHGYVLNFDIDEADKYNISVDGKKGDRYVLSNENKDDDNFIIKETSIDGYSSIYFPKGMDPIKSTGKYGFTHGGITPQEILLPHLKIKKKSSNTLEIKIANKQQLKEISSNNITIKLEAEDDHGLFKKTRMITLKIDGDKSNFSQDIEMNPGDKETVSLTMDNNNYTVIIMDTETKERLDTVKGKKKTLRGGLDGLNID